MSERSGSRGRKRARRTWIRAGRAGLLAVCLLPFVSVPDARTEEEGATAPASDATSLRSLLDPIVLRGEIELGGRASQGDDGKGKLLEYRDFDDGIFGRVDVVAEDAEGRFYLRSTALDPGYDDARYAIEAGRYGRYKLTLSWAELPHVYSSSARTLYQRPSPEVFRLPAGVQTRIAGAASPSTQLATELLAARPVDLGFRWLEGAAGGEYRVDEHVRLFGRYHLRDRHGSQARAIQFGSPGGTFDVFAGSVDDDTHRVEAGIEYASGPLVLGLEYQGSFYENDLRAFTVDNPLVALDAANAASRGRLSADPDNSAHTVSAFGSVALPVSFPARLTGSIAYGLRLQDDAFLPHTINQAIASPTLGASGLDGMVHTLLANVTGTARPHPRVSLRARYRVYRFDDATDPLRFPNWVRNDDAARTDAFRSVRSRYTRQNGTISGDVRILPALKARLAYVVEAWHRSDDRQVQDLVEHGPTLDLVWNAHPRATFEAAYRFEDRVGDRYRTLAFFASKLDEADFTALRSSGIAELPGLRKFDQADRRLHRFDLRARLAPRDRLDLVVDGGVQQVAWVDSDYGLTDQRAWHVGLDGFHQLHPRVGLGVWYRFEQVEYDQTSRWRSRPFVPPIVLVDDRRNDWQSRNESRFHSLGANVVVVAIVDRLELELGYQLHRGVEEMGSGAIRGFVGTGGVGVGADQGVGFDYPDVEEMLHVATATATLRVDEALKLVARYRFEAFEIRDYRTDDLGPYRGGSDVYLGNVVEDYDAHVLVLSAVLDF